jgi:hypothetical protein
MFNIVNIIVIINIIINKFEIFFTIEKNYRFDLKGTIKNCCCCCYCLCRYRRCYSYSYYYFYYY